jgi:hypothetical protein
MITLVEKIISSNGVTADHTRLNCLQNGLFEGDPQTDEEHMCKCLDRHLGIDAEKFSIIEGIHGMNPEILQFLDGRDIHYRSRFSA